MSSYDYSFTKFIDAIKDKDFFEIVKLGEQEASNVERTLTSGRKGVVEARKRCGNYLALLGEFLFFMKNGIKPYGVYEENFQLYRPVCENLVKKGFFKQTIMDYFK